MKKIFGVFLFALMGGDALLAQEPEILKLRGEVRGDYQREYLSGEAVKSQSGFRGSYLNLRLDGSLSRTFSYSFRHRLNKADKGNHFFDATDWVYLTYKPSDRWEFAGGKQVVGIGGYEYDRAPIDLYFCSEYWNNVPCYQWGGSVAYTTKSGADKFLFQLCQSPFDTPTDDLYALNLMWYGSHGPLGTIYSANLIEYLPGQFITYLALGHKFTFGKFSVELDWMNRATRHQKFFFYDTSVMGELSWQACEQLRVFGKVTYDVNRSNEAGDYCVLPGTELTRMGGGLEYFPLRKTNQEVRIHAGCCYAYGRNSNPAGTTQPKQTYFNMGLTWKTNLLSLKK